jgi:hypothetical protein
MYPGMYLETDFRKNGKQLNKVFFAPLALACWVTNALADGIGQDPTILGMGNILCKELTTINAPELNSPEKQWFLGVVTGHNLFYVPKTGSSFLKFDESNLTRFFQSYCAENPDKKLVEAVKRFFAEDIEKLELQATEPEQ